MSKHTTEQRLINLDIRNANLSIEHACEVLDCLTDTLEAGMNKHEHFDGYIEEYINRARWVVSKIFEDATTIQKAVKESEGGK